MLSDRTGGWMAIDPKGVIGERAFEIGAALRNPYDRPDVYASPAVITRRVERCARLLRLDASRVLSWAFAQAVLAAVWSVEDGDSIEIGTRWVALAEAMRLMLTDDAHP